jgi:predicted  nucleic acid-binding Zn-ribbon protein
MSNADPAEVNVVVERDGVTVEKSFEPEDFPVPAIAFVIRSERDVAVKVRLADAVPDDIEAEDIGFHPKYGADFWDNAEGKLVFEREFEAGEEYTTVYGLRARDTESVERFLGEPELEEVSPGLEEEPEDAGEVVSNVMNETDSEASDDDLEAAIAAADVEDGDADDLEAAIAAAEEGDTTAEADTSSDGAAAPPEPATVSVEDVTATLADEIRAGSVSDDDIETLRDALGVEEEDGSVEARISHLQTEVSDLQAYTAALEEFLDENGEAQTLLSDLKGTVEGFESELEVVREDVDEVADAAEAVDEMESEVSELTARVQSLDDRLENVGSDVKNVESSVNSLSSDFEGLRNEVDAVGREMEEVRDEMPEEDIAEMDDQLESLDDRMADLEEELDDLAQMRERMASVFGGAGGGDEE